MDIDAVLKQRGEIYGSYNDGVFCRATMMKALNDKHINTQGSDLPAGLRVMLSDISLKLMRIASDPEHLDSYVDLAGYAKLMKEVVVDGK